MLGENRVMIYTPPLNVWEKQQDRTFVPNSVDDFRKKDDMCLTALIVQAADRLPLVFAANRDEFCDRASAPAAFGKRRRNCLPEGDLVAGGTAVRCDQDGRIAAITNYREPGFHRFDAPSRGKVVSDFLRGEEEPEEYLRRLEAEAHRYNGFSLFLGYPGQLFYFSNRNDRFTELKPGLYGLSNHLLDSPWPKVERGKRPWPMSYPARQLPSG